MSDERRSGKTPLRGRPLDENGGIQFAAPPPQSAEQPQGEGLTWDGFKDGSDAVHAHLQHQVDTVNRSGMMPVAEADAAVAAAYEQAVMVADKEARRVGDRIPYFPEAGLSGTVDSLKSVANAIRSLTPQSALDALREQEAQWRLDLWHLLFPEGTHAEFEPQDIARWLDAYTEEAVAGALDRLWSLMRDGWETQRAMDKVKEEAR